MEELRPILKNCVLYVDDAFAQILSSLCGLEGLVERYKVHNVISLTSLTRYIQHFIIVLLIRTIVLSSPVKYVFILVYVLLYAAVAVRPQPPSCLATFASTRSSLSYIYI